MDQFCAVDLKAVLTSDIRRTHCQHSIGNEKRASIHQYLSFRAAVKTDAGTAAAAHTDEGKVRIARDSTGIV